MAYGITQRAIALQYRGASQSVPSSRSQTLIIFNNSASELLQRMSLSIRQVRCLAQVSVLCVLYRENTQTFY